MVICPLEQANDLEKADNEFRKPSGPRSKVSDDSGVCDGVSQRAQPTSSSAEKRDCCASERSQLDSRAQFAREPAQPELRHGPGSFSKRMIDFDSGAAGATNNAADLLPVDLQNEMIRLLSFASPAVRSGRDRSHAPRTTSEIPAVTASRDHHRLHRRGCGVRQLRPGLRASCGSARSSRPPRP